MDPAAWRAAVRAAIDSAHAAGLLVIYGDGEPLVDHVADALAPLVPIPAGATWRRQVEAAADAAFLPLQPTAREEDGGWWRPSVSRGADVERLQGRSFRTRPDAEGHARKVLARRRAKLVEDLGHPNATRLREDHGLPAILPPEATA